MPLAQDRTALLACLGRPSRLGIVSTVDSERDLFDGKVGHIRNPLPGRGTKYRKAVPILDPVPIYIGAGLEKRGIV